MLPALRLHPHPTPPGWSGAEASDLSNVPVAERERIPSPKFQNLCGQPLRWVWMPAECFWGMQCMCGLISVERVTEHLWPEFFYSSTLTKGKKLENYNWHEKRAVVFARSLLVLQWKKIQWRFNNLIFLENVTTLTRKKMKSAAGSRVCSKFKSWKHKIRPFAEAEAKVPELCTHDSMLQHRNPGGDKQSFIFGKRSQSCSDLGCLAADCLHASNKAE